MYEYSQLESMLLPALQDIAYDLKVSNYRKYKRKELIEKIMEAENNHSDKPASEPAPAGIPSPDADSTTEGGEGPAKRPRMRIPVGGSKVFTAPTGEKAGSSDVSSLSSIKKTEPSPSSFINNHEQTKEA